MIRSSGGGMSVLSIWECAAWCGVVFVCGRSSVICVCTSSPGGLSCSVTSGV